MSNQSGSLTYRWARRIAISIVGGTVVLVGVAMIVLPGPAFIVIPAGLGILGLEFAWARVWLKKIKTTGQQAMNSVASASSRLRKSRNDSKDTDSQKPK